MISTSNVHSSVVKKNPPVAGSNPVAYLTVCLPTHSPTRASNSADWIIPEVSSASVVTLIWAASDAVYFGSVESALTVTVYSVPGFRPLKRAEVSDVVASVPPLSE